MALKTILDKLAALERRALGGRTTNPAQRGFTLVELLVVLSILTVLGTVLFTQVNTNKTQGQTLYTGMQTLGDAAKRFQVDTSCMPTNVQILFDENSASNTGYNTCGADLTGTWNGPYMPQKPVNGSGDWVAENIGPEVTLSFEDDGGRMRVVANNVPTSIAEQAKQACDGGDTSSSFSACELGSTGGQTTTFYFNFGQS